MEIENYINSIEELEELEELEEVPSQTIKEKWQGAVNETSGFVGVPVSLLKLQKRLGLTAVDMIVLINLLSYWWDSRRSAFPRNSIVADRMGLSERTIQRSVNKMVRSGLIERAKNDKDYRVYSFNILAKRLALMINGPLAEDNGGTPISRD